ncbi:MAG: molybdopterin-binding protein [Acidilobaceae archaeon]|nr:molybdopterin-binding protein [Acidilobaceae archaeon]MCX8166119.1 molybdopterin-binding protein [Acidilobaceae archaeon]MDW7974762.1 molybdopterin-binding protein [Sulfolobales archaeon]
MRLALVVTSDSVFRGERRDEITQLVRERKLFELVSSVVVPNRLGEIRAAVLSAAQQAEVVLVTGGTGLSPRDVSIEAVEGIARKRVPGLGEEHRRRSYSFVGPRALGSRADGYVVGNSLVFVSPGNPSAVSLSLDILAEVAEHLVEEIRGTAHGRSDERRGQQSS